MRDLLRLIAWCFRVACGAAGGDQQWAERPGDHMRICNPDKLSHIEFCRERIVIDERTGRVLKNSYQGIPAADSDEQLKITKLVAQLRQMVG